MGEEVEERRREDTGESWGLGVSKDGATTSSLDGPDGSCIKSSSSLDTWIRTSFLFVEDVVPIAFPSTG